MALASRSGVLGDLGVGVRVGERLGPGVWVVLGARGSRLALVRQVVRLEREALLTTMRLGLRGKHR